MLRFIVCAVVGLSACAPEHEVLGRAYELRVPKDDDGSPLPLLILAHGYGVNGIGQDLIFPFSKQVDGKRFLYVEAHGTQDRAGRRFWNATDACCNFEHLAVDDVAFFRALIDDVKAQHAVTSVFVVGHSNGGFMTLRLACEASDVIDAVTSVSASTWNDFTRCPAGRAIPMLLVHGTLDTTIPYQGKPGLYPAAPETGRRFARREGCTGDWEDLDSVDFLSGLAGAETNRQRFTGCAKAIELWSVEGAGHVPQFDARWTAATFDWLQDHAR